MEGLGQGFPIPIVIVNCILGNKVGVKIIKKDEPAYWAIKQTGIRRETEVLKAVAVENCCVVVALKGNTSYPKRAAKPTSYPEVTVRDIVTEPEICDNSDGIRTEK